MASSRNRLIFKFFRFIEGEAEGPFAISALVGLVLAVLAIFVFLKLAVL